MMAKVAVEFVFSTSLHWRKLISPTLIFWAAFFIIGFLDKVIITNSNDMRLNQYVIIGSLVSMGFFLIFLLFKFIAWKKTKIGLTSTALILQAGVISKSEIAVSLNEISCVSFELKLIDRFLRAGNLIVTTRIGSEFKFFNIPKVKKFYTIVMEQLQ